MRTIFISPTGDISDARYMRIPLGILYVAAVLEERGHQIQVIAVDLHLYTDEQVINMIKAYKPDIVGITTVTCNFRNGAKYSPMIKSIDPNIIVVIGGVHASFTVKETLSQYPDIDFIVVGEGERTAEELWERLERSASPLSNKAQFSDIRGLAYLDNDGRLIETGWRPFIQDLDSIPLPARHLVSVSGYKKFNAEAHVFASRGCAFKCKFCLLPKAEGNFRKRDPEKVVAEIEYLYRTYDYKIFKFVDNSLSTDKKNILEICTALKNSKLEIFWRCQTRLDLLDQETMSLMKNAGCKEILVGVESASERILNEVYNKKLNMNSIKEIFIMAQEIGIVMTPSFVMGYPDESPEELEATKKLIIDLYKENYRHPRMCYLTPFPGSSIADEVFDGTLNHFLVEMDWDKYTHICPTLRTKYMTSHELAYYYVDILAEITAANEERMQRIWPEDETPSSYLPPQVALYRMKEAIIQKNVKRLSRLTGRAA